MYPYYNPYTTQYQQQNNQYSMQSQQIVKVSGENGAKAYNMAPNSSVLLLDEQRPIIWLKTTDGAGYPQITPYKIEPYEVEPQPDLKNIEERIKKLEEAMNNGKSNSHKNESK